MLGHKVGEGEIGFETLGINTEKWVEQKCNQGMNHGE